MTPTIAPNDPRLKLRGIRRHGAGWRAEREVNGKPRRSPTLDIESTAAQLVAAWEALAADVDTCAAGSLAEAVANYLPTVKTQPTAAQKAAHLELLLQFVGRDRKPTSVKPDDIDKMIQHWHATPTVIAAGKRGRPTAKLAPETIRKRLAHIQMFFSVTLPKGAINPVRACSQIPAATARPEVRGVAIVDVARILDAMPDYRCTNPPRLSLAKIRAAVWGYTGLDPIQQMRLKPTDMDLTGPAPWVRSTRLKGKRGGRVAFTARLTEAGRDALVAFVHANAWNKFAVNGLNYAIKAAADRADVAAWGTFRGKDLRHSFGAEMYRRNRDQATVARFMGHAPGSKMTARYTAAAHDEIDIAAAAKFTAPKFKTPATPATPATVVKMADRRK